MRGRGDPTILKLLFLSLHIINEQVFTKLAGGCEKRAPLVNPGHFIYESS